MLNPTSNSTPIRAAMPTPTWTDERLELLKSGFEAGLTCRQIADDLGLTRNAVIGKLSRLGMMGEGRGGAFARPRVPKRTREKRVSQPRVLGALRAEPAAEELPLSTEHQCSLLDLNRATCRWPISHLGTAEVWYCGNAPERGFPYCAGHVRLAYQSARPRLARLSPWLR